MAALTGELHYEFYIGGQTGRDVPSWSVTDRIMAPSASIRPELIAQSDPRCHLTRKFN